MSTLLYQKMRQTSSILQELKIISVDIMMEYLTSTIL